MVPADVLIAGTTGHCWPASVVCCVDTWSIAYDQSTGTSSLLSQTVLWPTID